jgi:hypothetical protein
MTNVDMIGQVMFNYAPHRTVRIIKKGLRAGNVDRGGRIFMANFIEKLSLGKLTR